MTPAPAPTPGSPALDAPSSPTEQQGVDPEIELQMHAAKARAIIVDLCIRDVNAFCEFVLRDEEDDTKKIEQLDFHVEMQQALTKHRQLVVMAHPESGKTQQMAVGRALWKLGKNPNTRIMILGNSQESAKKSLSSVKKYIDKSEQLHMVFPELRRGDLWQDVAITVQRPTYSKDPSVQAVGYGSNNVLGSRVDVLIADDFLNMEVTSTEAQRRKISKWFRTTAMARCTADAEIAFLTNAWHPRDLAHELPKERGWKIIKRPIRVPVMVDGIKRMRSVWPQRWSEARIRQKEKDLGSLEFGRVYMCQPRDEADMIFKPEFIATCKERGRGVAPVYELETVPDSCVVVSAVDIGGRRITGANTSIYTVLLHPNGTRQLLWIESGRWGATEMITRVVNHGVRYKGLIAVENNGVQQHIVDLCIENEQAVVPIVPYTTGLQKADPRFGVASMSSELEGGRWIVPTVFRGAIMQNVGNEIEEWIVEMLDYTPEAHTGDRLMASWIAREVARRLHAYLFGAAATRGRIVGAQVIG